MTPVTPAFWSMIDESVAMVPNPSVTNAGGTRCSRVERTYFAAVPGGSLYRVHTTHYSEELNGHVESQVAEAICFVPLVAAPAPSAPATPA